MQISPVQRTTPVRLHLSREKGFDLQAVSRATNDLPAIAVTRIQGGWGNFLCVGDPGRIWIDRGMHHGLRVKIEANLKVPVTPGVSVAAHRAWLTDTAASSPSLGVAWGIPGWRLLNPKVQTVIERELWLLRQDAHLFRPALRNHNVACSCDLNEPCHGDTLLEFFND